MEKVAAEVQKDIEEMAKLGVYSKACTKKMVAYVQSHQQEIVNYRANGMSIVEISDHVRTLSSL